MPSERPIKLSIAALGGQGGGVLADWLVEIANTEGYLAQATSVPGVAQRTGATIYYLEFFPRALAAAAGRDPIMALMPVPGDVDCVLASELVEAARAVQRGLVTPENTTLIASSHRSYAISEKIALGDGRAKEGELIELVKRASKRLVLFDMEAVAERHHSVISSVMLGALSGSGVLPFRKAVYETIIRESGIAVSTNLAAFQDAYQRAERADHDVSDTVNLAKDDAQGDAAEIAPPSDEPLPSRARTPQLQPLLDRVMRFPQAVQQLALHGVRRTLDYQDPAYAQLYLQRLERIAELERQHAGAAEGDWALSCAVARSLALWMTFEDTIRVADLKTRAARFERVRAEIRAEPDQLFGVTEFMKPRVQEIAGTLPARIGRRLEQSQRLCSWLARWTGGRQIRTGTVSGFLMLHALGGLRRWRRGTLRFGEENARIEQWLARIATLAGSRYELAVELARAQRLVKGYGETHERGWRNFYTLLQATEPLAARADGAVILARLQAAALADEEGSTLARELAALEAGGPHDTAAASMSAVPR